MRGKAADDQGTPVADAQVIYFAPPPWTGSGEPVEVATKSDATGQFQLAAPALKRPGFFRKWAYVA